MPEPDNEELAKKLIARRNDLKTILDDTQVVEDVLANNIKHTEPAKLTVGVFNSKAAATERGSSTMEINYSSCKYLPRNANENPSEYATRLSMTPTFTETPSILQSRLGSMFKKPPTVDVPDEMDDFIESATLKGATLVDVITDVFKYSQIHGYCGVLVDRAANDKAGEEVSKPDADKLNKPILAFYTAKQILDFDTDDSGLKWVKLCETYYDAPDWKTERQEVKRIRIVDSEKIEIWEVRQNKDTLKLVAVLIGSIPHDAGKVPFFLFNPAPAEDGVGRSVLRGCAEADISAVRTFSELTWLLHMMCPLLTFSTNKSEDEIGVIGLGASRYIALQAGPADQKEELKFVQLDPTAVDKLSLQYEKLVAKAREQADRINTGSITSSTEQSGISKAWTFKTAEERILFLFGHHMEEVFNKILDLVAQYLEIDKATVTLKFPDSYDIQGPTDLLAQAERTLSICQTFKQNAAARLTLERLFKDVIPDPTAEDWDDIMKELGALEKEDISTLGAPANFDGKTNMGTYRNQPGKGTGGAGAADALGEEKADRSEGDKADYQGNRKTE